MRPSVIALALLSLAAPAAAQEPTAPWAACLKPVDSIADLTAAFEVEGWAVASGEEELAGLQAAAEPLQAMQTLFAVETAEGFDRHIAAAHENAPRLLADAVVLERDTLFAVLQVYGEGSRCTLAGVAFDDVQAEFAANEADITSVNGHEVLMSPSDSGGRADVTLYRLTPPSGSRVAALAPYAAIVMVQGQ